MFDMAEFLRMTNPIQHYAWGSRSVLAGMQGRSAPTEEPEAELWMGAHASAPSRVTLDGVQRGLDEVAPDLPFLLKILAIAAPLSIQVHPSEEQAREGFARENAAGVARDSAHRNYKDERAKPETVVALSPMWLLAGQQDRADLKRLSRELNLPWLADAAASECPVQYALKLDDDAAAAAVRACVTAADTTPATSPRGEDADKPRLSAEADPVERATHLIRLLTHHYPGDRGLLVALCMNMVHLAPGQALFTPDRQVHAYLSGTAVEIMGCSDNVLRAGLTAKHVDVPELLRVMATAQQPVSVLEPREAEDGVVRYTLWDPALSLAAVRVSPQRPVTRELAGVCMVLVTEGDVEVSARSAGDADAEGARATSGESLICLETPSTVTLSGDGRVFLVEAVTPAR